MTLAHIIDGTAFAEALRARIAVLAASFEQAAGRKAGLKQIDIINEPVAAALCYVLGQEGIWFTELANEQTILVYDLGGGTFDLSLVKYRQDEVRVIASARDTTDESAAKVCRDIARAFEEQLTYPGEIKVTLIRETRIIETAR